MKADGSQIAEDLEQKHSVVTLSRNDAIPIML